jgi:hypothetical protein
MKKGVICVTVLLALTLAFVPIALAHPVKPIREVYLEFDWDQYLWIGTMTGDIIAGDVVVTPGVATFPGSTEHFSETMEVDMGDGEFIVIYEEGVWSFKTFKVRTRGIVTAASASYAYLIGASVHGIGSTTALDSDPLTCIASFRIN